MYERVWSGTQRNIDETQWDLALDFDQETGLFRCSGALNGEVVESHECVDPVISGFMDEPSDQMVLDASGIPLIPCPSGDAGPIRPLLVSRPDSLWHVAYPEGLAGGTKGGDGGRSRNQDALHRVVRR